VLAECAHSSYFRRKCRYAASAWASQMCQTIFCSPQEALLKFVLESKRIKSIAFHAFSTHFCIPQKKLFCKTIFFRETVFRKFEARSIFKKSWNKGPSMSYRHWHQDIKSLVPSLKRNWFLCRTAPYRSLAGPWVRGRMRSMCQRPMAAASMAGKPHNFKAHFSLTQPTRLHGLRAVSTLLVMYE
jgi:hypothetical protein